MKRNNDYRTKIYMSPLFEIEDDDLFRQEEKRVIEYLYMFLVTWDSRYAEYAVEIVETAKSSIEYYRKNKSEYAIYDLPWRVRWVWLKKFSFYKKRKKREGMLRGIVLKDHDLSKIITYNRMNGWEQDQDQMAKELRISKNKLSQLKALRRVYVMSDQIIGRDGVPISTFDLMEDETSSSEDNLYDSEAEAELLSMIESVFTSYPAQKQPILADVITNLTWEALADQDNNEKYLFVSMPMLNFCKKKEHSATQKYIADKYGITPRSVSAIRDDFLARLGKIIQDGGDDYAP